MSVDKPSQRVVPARGSTPVQTTGVPSIFAAGSSASANEADVGQDTAAPTAGEPASAPAAAPAAAFDLAAWKIPTLTPHTARRARRTSDEDLLKHVAEQHALTAKQVASHLNMGQSAARRRLDDLVERGKLARRAIDGLRGWAYAIAGEARRASRKATAAPAQETREEELLVGGAAPSATAPSPHFRDGTKMVEAGDASDGMPVEPMVAAYCSDGTFIVEKGDARIELDLHEALALLRHLERTTALEAS